MRILIVSFLHPALVPGGAQQVAYEQFEAACAEGHEATMLAAMGQEFQATFGRPGAPIVPLEGAPDQYLYFPQHYRFETLSVTDWRTLSFLKEFIAALQPDVVHFHHYHLIGLEALKVARLAAPKAVICLTFHEMIAMCMADGQMVTKTNRDLCSSAEPAKCAACFPGLRPEFFSLRTLRTQALLDECDVFAFPSQFLLERYVSWGLNRSKSVVIANGQRDCASPSDKLVCSEKLNRFGFFGQLIDNKGLDIILDALDILVRDGRLPRDGIVLEINGANKQFASKAYLARIDEAIARFKTSSRVTIMERGPYDRSSLPVRMRSVDWVIVPSTWWEIFGLVVSEAWMFKRPVIVSEIAALKERVIDGVNGITFPARDPYSLSRVILAACNAKDKWKTLSAGISQPDTHVEMFRNYQRTWDACQAEFSAGHRRLVPPVENCSNYALKN